MKREKIRGVFLFAFSFMFVVLVTALTGVVSAHWRCLTNSTSDAFIENSNYTRTMINLTILEFSASMGYKVQIDAVTCKYWDGSKYITWQDGVHFKNGTSSELCKDGYNSSTGDCKIYSSNSDRPGFCGAWYYWTGCFNYFDTSTNNRGCLGNTNYSNVTLNSYPGCGGPATKYTLIKWVSNLIGGWAASACDETASYFYTNYYGDTYNGHFERASYQPYPLSYCGNNIKETGEECDDENTVNGDGCSSSCVIEVLSSNTCSNSSQTIMKLSSQNNSHAALWNDTTYSWDICYNEIFGTNYTGMNPHNCSNNFVLWLSNVTDSHASTFSSSVYNVPVCYGNLNCMADTSAGISCANQEYKVVVRLFNTTNSHVSNAADINYPVKICCGSGVQVVPGNTFWTDMNDVNIGRADLNDEVKMNVESPGITPGMDINYTVYQKCSGLISCVLSAIFGDKKIAKITGKDSAAWGADKEGNNYYFTAKLSNGTIYNSENEHYGLLNVTAPENNFFPVVIMDEPIAESKHLVNSNVDFKQSSYDIDDALKAIWDFNDGNVTTLLNCNNGENCNTPHSYSLNGVKIVRLTAQEMRSSRNQKNSTARRIYVYSEGINAFAVISKPDPSRISEPIVGNVEFNASLSYVANCSNCSTFEVCPVCPVASCYNVSGFVNGEQKKIQCFNYPKGAGNITLGGVGTYNMWFDWTFDEPPVSKYGNWVQNYTSVVEFTRAFIEPKGHEISLRVGFEPHSS